VIWVLAGVLALCAFAFGARIGFRRYQDFRIRQHRRRMAWHAYKQSRGGPR